jgi:MFS family permease
VFAAIAGAGFEAAGALAGPFLIDRGRTTESVGLFFSLVSLPAMAAGALAGGRASDSFSPRRVTVLGLLWLCAVLGALAAADIAGRHDALVPLLALLYLGIGVFTAGSYSLFMEITDRRLGATQFSAFMGATNLCESWSSVAGGKIAGVAGYATAFAVMGAASAVGFAIVPWIRPKKGKPSADTSQRALFHGQRAHDERHC